MLFKLAVQNGITGLAILWAPDLDLVKEVPENSFQRPALKWGHFAAWTCRDSLLFMEFVQAALAEYSFALFLALDRIHYELVADQTLKLFCGALGFRGHEVS